MRFLCGRTAPRTSEILSDSRGEHLVEEVGNDQYIGIFNMTQPDATIKGGYHVCRCRAHDNKSGCFL